MHSEIFKYVNPVFMDEKYMFYLSLSLSLSQMFNLHYQFFFQFEIFNHSKVCQILRQ